MLDGAEALAHLPGRGQRRTVVTPEGRSTPASKYDPSEVWLYRAEAAKLLGVTKVSFGTMVTREYAPPAGRRDERGYRQWARSELLVFKMEREKNYRRRTSWPWMTPHDETAKVCPCRPCTRTRSRKRPRSVSPPRDVRVAP